MAPKRLNGLMKRSKSQATGSTEAPSPNASPSLLVCSGFSWRNLRDEPKHDKRVLPRCSASGRRGFRVVQLEADAVVHYALGPAIRVREKFYDIGAAVEEGSVEGKVFCNPIGADAIALHGAGRGQRASFADGFVVRENFDIATGMGSAKGQTKRGLTARRCGHGECDRPRGAADIAATEAG